uniref:Uncharacterized protein n=1 Tax=Trichogramma kaykai TaxID=54128 RepID=A0ABD2X1M6_9HYME
MKYIPSLPPPPTLLDLMAKPCRDTHCQFSGCSVCMCTCLCAQVQSDEQQRRLLSTTTRRRRLCCFYCVARRASTTNLNQTLRISVATTTAKKKKKTKEKNKAREKKVEYRSRRGWILMIYEDCVRRESEPGLRRE